MKPRRNGNRCFIWVIAGVLLALGQAASAAPNMPGHIKVGKVTATTAVVHWGASVIEGDAHVFYDVQLRRRIEGKPTEWDHVAETAKTEVALRHLKSGTVYEVRVRGWVNKEPSAWRVKENAFTTLAAHDGNDEGEHGEEVDLRLAWVKGEAEKHVAAIWWHMMGDTEAKLAYDVQLRPRTGDGAGEWAHAAETTHREVKVDGLKAGTVYGVRVRAWHKKKPGPWKVRERVFTTMGDDGEEPDVEGENENVGPVIAWIKAGASDKIVEIGWHLLREFDRKVIFEVQIRERGEGEVGEWRHEAETAKRGIHVDGLHPHTTYDVRVRGWLGDKPGEWKIREKAFRTKQTGNEDDGQAGTPQVDWIKADDIGPRAGVAKWSLVRELNAKVGYEVQIRTRIEGKAGEWKHEAETSKNSIIIDGLKPDTHYEIRVRPWANEKVGEWEVLENAFKTRKGEEGDGEGEKGDDGEHEGDDGERPTAPSQPGVIKVSKVTPNSALIHWGASKAPGVAKAIYDVQIRQRLAGKPTKWRYVGETFKTEFAVGKLEAGTLYEVRVRAWAGKTPGPWQIKENAFTTGGGEGEQTIDNAGHIGFQVIPGSKMRLTWPAGKGRFVVESTENLAISTWATVDIRPVQVSQMMVIDLPIGEHGMRFFRVRN